MKNPITVAQLQALRSLAAESPDAYPMLRVLCDRVEHLQAVEQAALNFVNATSEQSAALSALELCRELGVNILSTEPAGRLAA